MRKKTYCYICGTKLEPRKQQSWWCPDCKFMQFVNPLPGSEVILYRDGKILISERGIEPSRGRYDVPGGFVEVGESAEEAAYRELSEELGIDKSSYSKLKLLRTYSANYPYGNDVFDVLCIVFVAELTGDVNVVANDDVASLRWVSKEELSSVRWASLEQLKSAHLTFDFMNYHK